jgi:hypothetical protein
MAGREILKPKSANDGAIGGAAIQGVASMFGPIGQAVGGAVGGAVSQEGAQKAAALDQDTTGGATPTNSLDAAQRQLDKENANEDIRKGYESLQNMDDETKAKYGPVLEQAMALSQQSNSQAQTGYAGKLRRLEQTP